MIPFNNGSLHGFVHPTARPFQTNFTKSDTTNIVQVDFFCIHFLSLPLLRHGMLNMWGFVPKASKKSYMSSIVTYIFVCFNVPWSMSSRWWWKQVACLKTHFALMKHFILWRVSFFRTHLLYISLFVFLVLVLKLVLFEFVSSFLYLQYRYVRTFLRSLLYKQKHEGSFQGPLKIF